MDVLGSLRAFFKTDRVCIDNCAFRVCTKATFVILISASLLVTSRQYIGDPIDCIVDEIPPKIMDTYCWFYSTYTLTNRLIGIAGRDVAHPGVAHSEFDDTVKYHRYYQWVCFALFFQAMLSYLPRYLWKTFEGGRIKVLAEGLHNPIIETDKKNTQKSLTVNYIKENLNRHSFYAYRFFLCELLNLVIAIAQIFFTNYFLDGEFLSYGIDVLLAEREINPMTRVFPKMTKCIFSKYGPSGSIQRFDGLCVLPVNNINEKIYLFLWFWFIAMCILAGIAVVYRIFVCLIPRMRLQLLAIRAQLTARRDIQYILHRFHIGDWFLLYQLSKNIEPIIFKELCRDLTRQLSINF